MAWIIFFFLITNASAQSWQKKVSTLLPKSLRELQIGKSTISDVEKKIGKANLVEGVHHYWEVDGFKYAVTLTFKKRNLDSIHYIFTKERPSWDLVKDQLRDPRALVPFNTRYQLLKDGTSELVIDPATKTIYSVKLP